jgi:hypothetical protein
MLDGRIDHQGTVSDLRAQGVLDDITGVTGAEVSKAELVTPATPKAEEENTKKAKEAQKPRKLVKDEHRELGGVKWSIYESYLKSSYANSLLPIFLAHQMVGHIGSGHFSRFSLSSVRF